MSFPSSHSSRTDFASCGKNAPKAADAFARALADKGFDAEIPDDAPGVVDHTCDDPEVFGPLVAKAEGPFLTKDAGDGGKKT